MMKHMMTGAVVLLAGVGASGWSSAFADDRELQAILVKQACVPGSIGQTNLSPVITVYEIVCKGSRRVFTVVCASSDCRLQSKSREDEER